MTLKLNLNESLDSNTVAAMLLALTDYVFTIDGQCAYTPIRTIHDSGVLSDLAKKLWQVGIVTSYEKLYN